ncbi:MAG: GTP-binding protein [Clostridiales bacterium]|nr:GTP-binding protein [Clostridiales bacterium]
MIKVDIISGFLGAGKTTLIKKLYQDTFKVEKVAIVENEFGKIGIDGAFLGETGVSVKEINSGCICCSLSGDFKVALSELTNEYSLDRIIIEPSGVGKLSEVVSAVKSAGDNFKINVLCTVVDGNKVKMYHKNFGEFYVDQITTANTILLSKIEDFSEQKLIEVTEYIKQFNPTATIITTPVYQLEGKTLLENLEDGAYLMEFIINALKNSKEGEHGHRHEHHHDHGHCDCDHEHHHEHGHCGCGDPNCKHEHHHADEVFESFSTFTPKRFSKTELENILSDFDEGYFGEIVRAKGVLNGADGWIFFDYVPNSFDIRDGEVDVSGKVCVIGRNLQTNKLKEIFN